MQRVLFYLPVVTPWWFDNIVIHLIRTLVTARVDVHVLVPPLWRNTGIGAEQLAGCPSLAEVTWHIADGDDHPSLRTGPADPDEIVDFVRALGPSHIFCRSADIDTPSRFPGQVRHLLEAGAPPVASPPEHIILQRDFWHHGAMPDLPDEDRHAIATMAAPIWQGLRDRTAREGVFALSRTEALRRLELPEDRAIVALPLEYEHAEAFTDFHNRFARNLDLLAFLAERLGDEVVLAVTDHPLNRRHVDNRIVYEAIAALGDRARLVPNPSADCATTDLAIKHCDGLIVQNTKAIYAGAFFGRPILRLSHRPSAPWLGAHDDLETFLEAITCRRGGPSEEQAKLWFGYHLLHEVIDPAAISAAELLDRVDRPYARDRLRAGFERVSALHRRPDLAA